ncbi:MAG TPA: hypothetical protein EYP73_04425 [Acidimicrobiia bacterium]|nr:hypothetical protein [Acidimicrobiia bacterium]
MIEARAIEAIEASDTDELLRVVDGFCATRAWDDLVELRSRCREAVGRGKQLWGVEEHIRYRLALEAPAAWAGPVVSEARRASPWARCPRWPPRPRPGPRWRHT